MGSKDVTFRENKSPYGDRNEYEKARLASTSGRDCPAIDTHWHAWTKETCNSYKSLGKALFGYLYHKNFDDQDFIDFHPTEEEMVEHYRMHNAVGMPVGWDGETVFGDPPVPNEYIAHLVKTYPDVFLAGWVCVDPNKGYKAVKEIEKGIEKLNLIGVKFQQAGQNFNMMDPQHKILWECINSYGVPVQFHTGYTGLGSGAPGAQGIRLEFNRVFPHMEYIASKYTNSKYFALHVGDPWVDDVNAIARHMENVYRECSGMWPQYWPEDMWYELNRRLKDKYVWGTDYPLFSTGETLTQISKLNDPKGLKGFKDEKTRQNVLWRNAINIFKDDFKRVGVDLSRWGVKD